MVAPDVLPGDLDATLKEYAPIFRDDAETQAGAAEDHGIRMVAPEPAAVSREASAFPGFDLPANRNRATTLRYQEPVAAAQPVAAAPAVAAATPAEGGFRELTPVPASVFDDDFFRRPIERFTEPEREHRAQPLRDVSSATSVQGGEGDRTQYPEPRIPSFAGYAAAPEHEANLDELDKPAFLRGRSS